MDQGDNHYASASIPMKRKRGRPRKYPIFHTSQNTQPQRDQNISPWKKVNLQENQTVNHGINASVPPGFETPNGNQPRQGDHGQSANNIMVGQVVSGVVEAVFDAGCLLAVRVGNSHTILRGVVFRPGQYVPVSDENDLAPNVQMIRRKEIPLPIVSSVQLQAKEKNSPLASLPSNSANPPSKLLSAGVPKITISDANPSISRNKQTPAVTQAANLSSAGGNTGLIVTQSAHSSNGAIMADKPSSVVSQTAPPTALGNQGASLLHLSNASATSNQLTTTDNVIGSRTQTTHQKMLEGKPNEMGPSNHSATTQNNVGANSTISPEMSFQNLLTEVMKRAEPPSQGMNPRTELSMPVDIMPVQEPSNLHGNEANATIQAVGTIHHNSAADPNATSSQDNRTSKMTELLRVLQENFDGNKNLEPRRPHTG